MNNFYAKFHAPLPTALWVSDNPYLAEFEFGEESDGGRGIKLGPGYWNDLPYFTARVQRSYLESTITYNNVDTLADTALVGNVMSGGLYKIELNLHSTSVGTGLVMDFGGTATIANFIGQWIGYQVPIDESGPTRVRGERVTDAGTDVFTSDPFGAMDTYYVFTGSMEIGDQIGDAGTFLLRSAQVVAVASDTTILAGATMILTQMN